MSSERAIESFVEHYVDEIRAGTAAIFAGAGLSAGAGYVDWRGLLRPLAIDLGLDVTRENDLVAVAQYYCNTKGNRGRLNQVLMDRLADRGVPTENHHILASLPIATYWTTNYDRLLEAALKEAGKIADAKYDVEQLAITRSGRDVTIFKMHGDIEHPNKAVLTKDDYEKYHIERGAFVNALAGDLVSKTFLFLGFSFTDPNLDYVLGRMRATYKEHQRQHYCVIKRRSKTNDETDDDFRYAQVRQQLAIEDLKRFNIQTLVIDDYADVTKLLQRLAKAFRARTIFISGSAVDFSPWGEAKAMEFLRKLAGEIINHNFRIVSGLGLGVGSAVVTGAIEAVLQMPIGGHIEDFVTMRPFPRAVTSAPERDRLYEEYRQMVIRPSGMSVVVFGNKESGGSVVNSPGVLREAEIAASFGSHVVPVGATGSAARELWEKLVADLPTRYPGSSDELAMAIRDLGAPVAELDDLLPRILRAIELISKE